MGHLFPRHGKDGSPDGYPSFVVSILTWLYYYYLFNELYEQNLNYQMLPIEYERSEVDNFRSINFRIWEERTPRPTGARQFQSGPIVFSYYLVVRGSKINRVNEVINC